jgi:hypothetical protein
MPQGVALHPPRHRCACGCLVLGLVLMLPCATVAMHFHRAAFAEQQVLDPWQQQSLALCHPKEPEFHGAHLAIL